MQKCLQFMTLLMNRFCDNSQGLSLHTYFKLFSPQIYAGNLSWKVSWKPFDMNFRHVYSKLSIIRHGRSSLLEFEKKIVLVIQQRLLPNIMTRLFNRAQKLAMAALKLNNQVHLRKKSIVVLQRLFPNIHIRLFNRAQNWPWQP